MTRHRLPLIVLGLIYFLSLRYSFADGLESYLRKEDPSFNWKIDASDAVEPDLTAINLTSQTWQGGEWKHKVLLIKPSKLKNPSICYLHISGSKDGRRELELLRTIANKSGSYAAVVSAIPNQPLFERKEDALLAYTFKKYVETGDEDWPVIFPMVKAVQRAMDVLVETKKGDKDGGIKKFVLAGASKRGWTTWLTSANDKRVVGLIPIVFDMLNMRAQVELAQKSYGRQSEKIKEYTELGLVDDIDQPRNAKLREWVDPFSYLKDLSMPKLIVLGTNDPYWVVDAQRNYFSELIGPKFLLQVPNGDHHITGDPQVVSQISAFFSLLSSGGELPKITWKISGDLCRTDGTLHVSSDLKDSHIKVWSAKSKDRDFRDDKWEAPKPIGLKKNKTLDVPLTIPREGFAAYMLEISSDAKRQQYSSESIVLPSVDCFD